MNTLTACCDSNRSDLIWVVANQDENTFLVTFAGVAIYDTIYTYLNGYVYMEYVVTQDMIDNGITIAGQDGDTLLGQTQLGSTAEDTLVGDEIANIPPVADAGADQLIDDGLMALLDGTGSFDSDGEIVSYVWTDSDGNVIGEVDSVDVNPTETTTYTLTVTDNDGFTATDTVTITVEQDSDIISIDNGVCDDNGLVVFTVDCSNLEVGDILTYTVT